MDFFTRQEKARRKTGLLVFLFVAAVALIILAIFSVTAVILISNKIATEDSLPGLLVIVAVATLALVIGGSLFKTAQLRRGGAAVAEMLGARLVPADTTDLREKQLRNVVEEMAIASGTPMPDVYVLDEEGINAFAAGWKTSDAAICVTRGGLNTLSRDELQGVIAHEFSHVLNGDMRMNIRLMGIIFGILVIGQLGYLVLRGSGSGRVRVQSKGKGGGGGIIILIAVALFIIGYIGVFFGNIIMAAVSRAREYLADASAVQFTRNPSGIEGALKKIGGFAAGSQIVHHNAQQASHLFFANCRTSFWANLFATHPPLDKRILAIDPAFDGEFPAVTSVSPVPERKAAASSIAQKGRAAAESKQMRFNAATLLASTGTVQAEHVTGSAAILQSIPNQIRLAMLDKNGAQAVIFSLLLSSDAAVRDTQLASVNSAVPAIASRLADIEATVRSLDRNLAIPVVSLAINSLKTMNENQYGLFVATLKSLIEADGQIDLFEYMLQRMVRRNLEPRFSRIAQPKRYIQSIGPVAADCAVIFSLLVWESSESPEEAEGVFGKGADVFLGTPLQLIPREQCLLSNFDTALERCAQLVPLVKKQLLSACAAIVAADGVITTNEAEYLRAIADALECPIPPVILSNN